MMCCYRISDLESKRFVSSRLYAVHMKIKKPAIAEFDRAYATWWDSAVAGNSCLREGIRRRFVSEVACLNGNYCVDFFSDREVLRLR